MLQWLVDDLFFLFTLINFSMQLWWSTISKIKISVGTTEFNVNVYLLGIDKCEGFHNHWCIQGKIIRVLCKQR